MTTDSLLFQNTVENLNNSYKPSYIPFYSIFTNRVKYDEIQGAIDFSTVNIQGDTAAKPVLAQQTEEKHFGLGENKKTYYKTFYGISLQHSQYERDFNEVSITRKILDQYNKEYDFKVLNGASGNRGEE
jgi:hypothetical protein